MPEPVVLCKQCSGVGLIKTERGSTACPACQGQQRTDARLSRLLLPPRLAEASLQTFQPERHTSAAYMLARRYVEEFVPGQTRTGLLFTGTIGTGKSHLAVAIARELVVQKGVEARFVSMRDLLDRLRAASGDETTETKLQIMRPIMSGELVVIDDLGSQRSTEWVFDVMDEFFGELYDQQRPVIVTTNLPNLPVGQGKSQVPLAERTTMRVWSRLQQMCAPIEMNGPDYRIKA